MFRLLVSKIKGYFNVSHDIEDEKLTIAQISSGVSFRGANLWVLIFAIFIASLGLNVNSTAVIIGAMLISPLMGPIIGMGLAIGINDVELLRRAVKNFSVATAVSVLTATVYFLLTPLSEAQSELLARTSPTIYDVLIATFGGAAGILAQGTKIKGNVIPGVAIATALMPPLCTAGFGLATGNLYYFFGAFYLFFINTVFISLSTYIGVRLMHFRRKQFLSEEVGKKAKRIIIAIVLVTMIPSAFMTVGIVKKSFFENNVRNFIANELSQSGTQVISNTVDKDSMVLNVVAVGKEITTKKQTEASGRLDNYGLTGYRLNIIQGEQSDSLLYLTKQISQIKTSRENEQNKILELTTRASALSAELADYTKYDNLTKELRGELTAIYPQVKAISLSKVTQAQRDTSATKEFVAAILSVEGKKRFSQQDRQRLTEWLKARAKADSLVVYLAE
ncbi:MAG: TIGR00341 family protein [Prevotella sp.]